jgi:SAM-dependent methyltransferase
MDTFEIEKLAAVEERHWWYRERRAVLDTLLSRLELPGAALDIGAACGGNTRVLQKHGWQATALDFSANGPEICNQRGVPAIRADATRLPCATASFDLVVAYDVLEHIDDDLAVIHEVHRVLKPGGRFLVAVPADPALWSAHDEAVGHFRRYTPTGLGSIMTDNHFDIARVWNWNVLIRPLLKMHRNRISGSDLDDPQTLINVMMTRIIRLERHLPLSRLPGISLFLEARSVAKLSLVQSETVLSPGIALTSASLPSRIALTSTDVSDRAGSMSAV